MNSFPTRPQIDRAPALEFNGVTRGNDPALLDNPKALSKRPAEPSQERQANITIEVAPDGLHIRAEYTGTLASIPQAIERLRAAGVLELVAASRPAVVAPVAASAPASAGRVDPSYNAAGDACCPVHHRKLSEGVAGLFCSGKAKDGQVADKKGYCGLRFTE